MISNSDSVTTSHLVQAEFTYSTADIERSLFYADERSLVVGGNLAASVLQPAATSGNVVVAIPVPSTPSRPPGAGLLELAEHTV